ncbi:hypothetical protein ACFQV2_25560 [Actinokineospora soli]|uniref:UDP-N-acetylglucosamine 1-carboxyvinyltransferase n=1 Tax=Actinokineospora soli TaxID=1048753 RepID=A0ABW2TTU0_9PSEU
MAGGCQIGDGPGGRRPVEQYVSVLERFGASARASATGLHVEAVSLRGCEIDLLDYTADRALKSGPLYSGACKMALLTAAVAHGTSVLRNLYPKPDVTDLVDVLAALGADVEVDGDAVVVRGAGPNALRRDVTTTLVPDLIEVVTWITAGAVLAGSPLAVTAPGIDRAVRALAPEFAVLRAMGVRVDVGQDRLVAHPADRLRPADVTVASHGVFSDSQPFLALLAAHAVGTSRITETVWTGRFGYQDGLAALGADLRRDGASLVVRGPVPPRSPPWPRCTRATCAPRPCTCWPRWASGAPPPSPASSTWRAATPTCRRRCARSARTSPRLSGADRCPTASPTALSSSTSPRTSWCARRSSSRWPPRATPTTTTSCCASAATPRWRPSG